MRSHALATVALVLSAMGCQQDTKTVEAKLDAIEARLGKIEDRLQQAPAAQRPAGQPRQKQEPDPKDVYAVPVAGVPFRGAPDALVTIIKAYEFACPYCEKIRGTHDQILKDYAGKVRIVYMDFLVHPDKATLPAQAVCAAHKQGKFAELETLMWDEAYAQRKFDAASITTLAAKAGLDLAQFEADFTGPCVAAVQQSHAALQRFGVGHTPAHFVNGRYLPGGAAPYAKFKEMIDEELAKAEQRGGAAASYYDTWVIAKGLKQFTRKP